MSGKASDHSVAVDAIYRAAIHPELWPETLVALSDHVGSSGAFMIYHSAGGDGSILAARLRDDLIEPYFETYARNPFSDAFARAAPGRVYAASRMVDMAAVRRSAFHADILAPNDMEEQLVFVARELTRNGSSGGLSFAFGRRIADRAGSRMRKVGALAPHLARAIELLRHVGDAGAQRRSIEFLLHALPGAAMLLDGAGRVLSLNAQAELLLASGDGLTITAADRRPAASLAGETNALRNLIARALGTLVGATGDLPDMVKLTRPSGLPALFVTVMPLPPRALLPWEAVDTGARLLLQVSDPSGPTGDRAERLRKAIGLTIMESRVAALIGNGLGVPEAAAALGLSHNTVRSHLAHCYDKAGVHSQAGLVRLLAVIPPAP